MSGKGVQAMIAMRRGGTPASAVAIGPFVSKPKFDAFFRALAGVLESEGGTWRQATAKLGYFFDQGKKPTGDELRLWIDHLVKVHDIPDHFFAYWQMRCGRNKARMHETTTGATMAEDLEALYVEETQTLKSRLADEETRRREAEEARDAACENVSAQHKTIEALREKADAADKAAAEASVRAARPVADSTEAKQLRKDLEEARQRGDRWEQEAEALQGQLHALREQARDERERCEADVRRARERTEAAEARAKAAEAMATKGSQQPSRIESIRIAIETLTRVADALGS